MELKTIREVSLDYGVSRRMLCYYEEIGLIKSSSKDDYAYRVYDENAIQWLQQIILRDKDYNDWDSPRWTLPETVTGKGVEETLNFYNFVQKGGKMEDLQLDLLYLIKEKGKEDYLL